MISRDIRTQLAAASPGAVAETLILRFDEIMAIHLFGATGQKEGASKRQVVHSILTPLELVPRIMHDLHLAYYVQLSV
jgi:hypothetical protein